MWVLCFILLLRGLFLQSIPCLCLLRHCLLLVDFCFVLHIYLFAPLHYEAVSCDFKKILHYGTFQIYGKQRTQYNELLFIYHPALITINSQLAFFPLYFLLTSFPPQSRLFQSEFQLSYYFIAKYFRLYLYKMRTLKKLQTQYHNQIEKFSNNFLILSKNQSVLKFSLIFHTFFSVCLNRAINKVHTQ